MYIPEHKPKLYLNTTEVDNISIDNKVFFIEDSHRYYFKDDIVDGKIVPFNKSKYKFRSPTGILADFKEHFDAVGVSERYVKKHGLLITPEELRDQWSEKARIASDRGSKLHAYCESIYDGWNFGEEPEEIQASHARDAIESLSSDGWKLAKTELLVFNPVLRLAGQVDLLLKKDNGTYGIFDYKFLKEPIKMKSFYNGRTRKYKMMSGPFRFLMDCNYYHYSIQMEFYRMLMGQFGDKITNKDLVVMTEDGYAIVPGADIKMWVSEDGALQASYKLFNGKLYDSSKDPKYMGAPFKLI